MSRTPTIWPRRSPGELTVTKTIAGPAAGQQGAITISVSCSGTALPDFVIPAGAPAGTLSRSYPGIAAGSTCTVTETGNGASSHGARCHRGKPADGRPSRPTARVSPTSLTLTATCPSRSARSP